MRYSLSKQPDSAIKTTFNEIEEQLGRDRDDQISIKDRTIDIDILGPVDEEPEVPTYLQGARTEGKIIMAKNVLITGAGKRFG